jgi:magnesium transporter
MLTAYLFDKRRGAEIEDWAGTVGKLHRDQVLWVNLLDPSGAEEDAIREAFDLGDADRLRLADSDARAAIEQAPTHIHVTAVAVSTDESEPERETAVIDCFIGENWVVSAHKSEIAVLDEFRTLAEGGSELGILDAPSFLATLFEWVVTSYSRAFDDVESQLEEFDISVLRSPGSGRNTEGQIAKLVEVRARVGRLRRALAPHREVFATLTHPELDLISTDVSAERFGKLTEQVDGALASARDAKDAVVSSFDVLILRTEHRTNEIVKVLTLASILLLPGALIAGVAGMNVNISLGTFVHSPLFWIVLAAIVSLAGGTLSFARARRWI